MEKLAIHILRYCYSYNIVYIADNHYLCYSNKRQEYGSNTDKQ